MLRMTPEKLLRKPISDRFWSMYVRPQLAEILSPIHDATPLEKAYELLKCRPSDANDVVRRAYRAAAKTYHPDMLRAASASEAQIKKATEMMAKINSAWDLIKESRGL